MKIKDGKDKYVTKLIEILSSSCKEKDRNQKIVAKIFIGLIDSLENVEDTTEYEDSLRDLVKDLISNDLLCKWTQKAILKYRNSFKILLEITDIP